MLRGAEYSGINQEIKEVLSVTDINVNNKVKSNLFKKIGFMLLNK